MRLSLSFLPRYMRYTPLICTDKELARKNLQHYAHPCLTNFLLSFTFHWVVPWHIYIYQHIYDSDSLGAILPSEAALASLALPTQGRDGWWLGWSLLLKIEKCPSSNHPPFFFPSAFHGLSHHYCKQLSKRTELGGQFPQKTNVAHRSSWELSRNLSDLDCQITNFKHEIFCKKRYS